MSAQPFHPDTAYKLKNNKRICKYCGKEILEREYYEECYLYDYRSCDCDKALQEIDDKWNAEFKRRHKHV